MDKAVGCGRRVKRVRVLRGSSFAIRPLAKSPTCFMQVRGVAAFPRVPSARILGKVIAHTTEQNKFKKNEGGGGGKCSGSGRREINQTNNAQ